MRIELSNTHTAYCFIYQFGGESSYRQYFRANVRVIFFHNTHKQIPLLIWNENFLLFNCPNKIGRSSNMSSAVHKPTAYSNA